MSLSLLTGRSSTRRFQTLLDGKIEQADSGGTGPGVGGADVGATVGATLGARVGAGAGGAVGAGGGFDVGGAVGSMVGLPPGADVEPAVGAAGSVVAAPLGATDLVGDAAGAVPPPARVGPTATGWLGPSRPRPECASGAGPATAAASSVVMPTRPNRATRPRPRKRMTLSLGSSPQRDERLDRPG